MNVNCPNCNEPKTINSQIVRGPGAGNEIWICIWCSDVICTSCYVKHGESVHAEKYEVKRSSEQRDKKKKRNKKKKRR